MKELVKETIYSTLKNLYGIEPPNFKVEKPREDKHGDLATNVSFLLAKELRKKPNEIAQEIAQKLSEDESFESVEAVGGFVNIRLSERFLLEEFSKLLELGEDYYREDLGEGEKIQLEFVSANPTGPLHLGHGRGAVVGDTLARLLDFYGFNVVREYYINDAGRQVYILGVSIFFRYLELFGKEDEFPQTTKTFKEEGYKGEYVISLAQMLKDILGEELLEGYNHQHKEKILSAGLGFELNYTKRFTPSDEPHIWLCAYFGLDAMMEEIRNDLREMGIDFDVWCSEKSLHDKGLVEKLINTLKERGLVYEKEGALWLKTSEFGDDKDRVLRKSDGAYTYFASDIAYHWDKFQRSFEKVIDLWGADHHGYIPRVKAALSMLGIDKDRLEVYLIQMVKLFKEGKEVKMSKRSGNFVTLRELMKDVGADAIRFVFLTKRSDTPLDFNVDLVKEKSSDNPVFYVQYAHARISGVFREFRERFGEEPEEQESTDLLKELGREAELKLIRKTLMMKDEFMDATLKRDPHLITYALIELAGMFHNFYNHNRIISKDEKLMRARLVLLKGVRNAIRIGLKLIGVSAPEKM